MSTSLKQRIISAVVAAIILLFMLYLRGYYLVVPGAIITLIGIYEFNNAFAKRGHKPMTFPALAVGLMSIIAAITNVKYDYKYAVLLALVSYLVLLTYQLFTEHQLIDLMISAFSVIYVALPLILVMLLAVRKDNLIYLIFIMPIFTDIFAYFVGRTFGKHKLIEKISPKKTIEGAIGGIVGCILATLVFRFAFYQEMGLNAAIILGIIGSLVAQVGDLTASKIKRYCKIKDFGKIMPGHGGVLDRIDSILFTSVLVFIYYWLFFNVV